MKSGIQCIYISSQSIADLNQGRTGWWYLDGGELCGFCCLGGLVLGGYDCGGRSAWGLCGLCGLWGCCGGRCWGGGCWKGGRWGLSSEPEKNFKIAPRKDEMIPISMKRSEMKRTRVVRADDRCTISMIKAKMSRWICRQIQQSGGHNRTTKLILLVTREVSTVLVVGYL